MILIDMHCKVILAKYYTLSF